MPFASMPTVVALVAWGVLATVGHLVVSELPAAPARPASPGARGDGHRPRGGAPDPAAGGRSAVRQSRCVLPAPVRAHAGRDADARRARGPGRRCGAQRGGAQAPSRVHGAVVPRPGVSRPGEWRRSGRRRRRSSPRSRSSSRASWSAAPQAWLDYAAVVRAGLNAIIVDPRNAGIAATIAGALGGGDGLARSLHLVVGGAASRSPHGPPGDARIPSNASRGPPLHPSRRCR